MVNIPAVWRLRRAMRTRQHSLWREGIPAPCSKRQRSCSEYLGLRSWSWRSHNPILAIFPHFIDFDKYILLLLFNLQPVVLQYQLVLLHYNPVVLKYLIRELINCTFHLLSTKIPVCIWNNYFRRCGNRCSPPGRSPVEALCVFHRERRSDFTHYIWL